MPTECRWLQCQTSRIARFRTQKALVPREFALAGEFLSSRDFVGWKLGRFDPFGSRAMAERVGLWPSLVSGRRGVGERRYVSCFQHAFAICADRLITCGARNYPNRPKVVASSSI